MVGASLLAMVVNDDACCLEKRSAFTFIASRLAPTGGRRVYSVRVNRLTSAPGNNAEAVAR
ncbi:hypothetical protein BSF44_37970 [Pseudomonas sp. ACN8]|nr:hypothetical protein BSF44_37970 [Pseudomonas sp. ACN8]